MSHRANLAKELVDRGRDEQIWVISGAAVTYAQLRAEVRATARRFAEAGIGEHSTVALRMPPSCTLLAALLALWTRGAQVMLVDFRLPRPEYEQLFALREPEFHVHSTGAGATVAGFLRTDEPIVSARPSGRADDSDVCVVQFSSGSTGTPKVIGRTAESIREELDRYASIEGMPGDGERLVLLNSVIHTMGLYGGVLHALNVGTTLIIPPHTQPKEILAAAADSGANAIFGVPVHFDLLTRTRDSRTLPALRLAVSAGESLPREVYDRFAERFGVPISPVYGMTEVGVITTGLRGQEPPPSVGYPAPGIETAVVDGELRVRLDRSPYLHTDHPRRYADGWLRTFDRFETDRETGALRIVGRADSVVTIGGLQVDLTEIDSLLSRHPKVNEVVVVYGEVVEAFVGAEESLVADELTAWCRDRLRDIKIPKKFFIGQRVPRNANGKLLRNRDLLHEAYAKQA